MNFVIIMTDTQSRNMVGAYGEKRMDTPNLDRLAAGGVRFDRAYTTCPLCTPARSGIFSGTHPTVNGAWCNNVAPSSTVPLMGTIFSHYGYTTAFVGKWHLDGSGYFGDGVAGGGFADAWWYDGKRYAQDVGHETFNRYRTGAEVDAADVWGHRVANRAVDFLKCRKTKDPFLLVASFDEPHGPYRAPAPFHEAFDTSSLEPPPNFGAPLPDKPRLQQIHREHGWRDTPWEAFREKLRRLYACNAAIDREIGRVIHAVEAFAPEETTILYTSDHGDMQGAHGLSSKGPMMYEEIIHVPFIVKSPGCATGQVTQALASHVDILPTLLDLASLPSPESLQGTSLAPTLRDPRQQTRQHALTSFSRFAINHDDWGEFYPIRCLTDGRYKLAINLFESDEFYDLQTDPFELNNILRQEGVSRVRDRLHDALLDEMDRIRDPFRSYRWGDRDWRSVRQPFYQGGKRRHAPRGFPFQPVGIEADGTSTGGAPPAGGA